MANDELFPVVDEQGNVVGSATRGECHSGSMILHPVVHLHVLNRRGDIYLQKRSLSKDIQPGKWDTAVGGHVDFGESIEKALHREAREELGINDLQAKHLLSYVFQSSRERELVNTYYTISDATGFDFDPVEIDEGRFWTVAEISAARGTGVLTPNFEQEFQRILPALQSEQG